MVKIESLMRDGLEDSYGILKLQNIILNIMKYIDELCEKHHIEYYIIGGTALGAVRHGGFIPWDDDLDIAMTRNNYDRFLTICEKEIDQNDFYLQVGRKGWPLYFSKLRLKGTLFEEVGAGEEIAKENRGIFVDIFPLDTASNNICGRIWQYVCSKLLIAQAVGSRHYQTNSFFKKLVMQLSYPIRFKSIEHFFFNQVTRYNNLKTKYIGDFFEISKLKDASYSEHVWGKPVKIPFEKMELYAPENMKEYLAYYFGDYMVFPPVEKRVCGHNNGIDFGDYRDIDIYE